MPILLKSVNLSSVFNNWKDFLISPYHEPIQKLRRMECIWCLYCHRRETGHCHYPYPTVFYLYITAHYGVTHYHLPGTGFLEKYEKIYCVGKEKPMVLSLGPSSLFIKVLLLTTLSKGLFVQFIP